MFKVGIITKSMSIVTFQDINRCLHFVDDWDEEDSKEQEGIYLDDKYKARAAKASYQV